MAAQTEYKSCLCPPVGLKNLALCALSTTYAVFLPQLVVLIHRSSRFNFSTSAIYLYGTMLNLSSFFLPFLFVLLTTPASALAQVAALPGNSDTTTCRSYDVAQNWTVLTFETFASNTTNVNSFVTFYFADEANSIFDHCGMLEYP